ncbi:MAG: acyl-CoA dehydrogenase [Betaproteobacteria bacterium]|nr:acyl-CoA dehydrogenase [Betaproteobacteria bacterium]
MSLLLLGLAGMAAALTLAATNARGWQWAVSFGALLAAFQILTGFGGPPVVIVWGLLLIVSCLLLVGQFRRILVSEPLLGWFRRVLPTVSQTERDALEAGSVWWDGELFSGQPDWKRLLSFPKPGLTAEEQAFLDGPVEELCGMLDDWEVSYELNDLPPQAWEFIKTRGFFGMIIPKAYGGLGFSALAHSEVVMKLATRSATATVSVMVPNSLGPAELLLRYGTDEQKRHYLPRLARGLEIPCFALTGPEAGSDAGSIPDRGVVCRATHDGREVLGMRVSWEKRYITLGPVATLLGLAFRLHDPDGLLGRNSDLGITLALIPADHPGVEIGRRHMPLNGSFMNGPNSGTDVFIPMDWIIGGPARAGQGWRMLMECLAAGRSISLPSSAAGMMKLAARTTGAYARVRTQFGLPIARFEGVDEAIARIGAHTYAIDSARTLTAGAVDLGEHPSVISAIVKYHATERGRSVVNDAMDVHGGKGICLGPANYLGRAYQQVPIAITVEGANILTRSMIIFGQGAIRCHPYVLREIEATRMSGIDAATRAFDDAFRAHVTFVMGNFARAFLHGITLARFAPGAGSPETRPHFRELSRLSSAFAFAADIAMLTLGGSLKRREKLSARLGDVLSQMYLASAVLKRFEDDDCPEDDLPIVEWCVRDALFRAERALVETARNFPSRLGAILIRLAAFPLGPRLREPSDQLGTRVAKLMAMPSASRERVTRGMYILRDEADPVGRLELALVLAPQAEALLAKIRAVEREGGLHGASEQERLENAVGQGLLTPEELQVLGRYRRLQRACIMVDDFPHDVGRHVRSADGDDRMAGRDEWKGATDGDRRTA